MANHSNKLAGGTLNRVLLLFFCKGADDMRQQKRFYKPYKVSDEEIARLKHELKGHMAKVAAIVVLAENDGYVTQEEVADLIGVARMTLYRWYRYDYVYAFELERQYELMSEHYRRELFKRSRKKIPISAYMADMNHVSIALGLS